MDERVSQASAEQPSSDNGRLWQEQRRKAAGYLAAQRERLDEVEAQLSSQIDTIGSILEAGLNDNASLGEVERLRAELERRQSELDVAQEHAALELQTWSDQLRHKQDEIERQEAELEGLAVKLKQSQRSLTIGQEEHEAEVEQLARRKLRFEEQQRRLDTEHEGIENEREETRVQRRRIAQQLKQEKNTQFQELDLRKAELETLRVTLKQEAERNAQLLSQELDAQSAQLEQQRQQLRRERAQFDTQLAEFEESRRQFDAARLHLDQLQAEHHGSTEARSTEAEQSLIQLQTEYERLQQHCHRQQEQIREFSERQVTQTGELEVVRSQAAHLQIELEQSQELAQAVEHELTSLRVAYEQLREELAARAAAPPTVVVDETQVQRLTGERDALSLRLNELEGELSAANARHAELQKTLQSQLETTAADLHRAAADRLSAAASADAIAALVDERDGVIGKLLQIENELSDAQRRIVQLEALAADRDALAQQLAQSEAVIGQVGRQQAALLALAAERDQLQTQLKQAAAEQTESRSGQVQAVDLARQLDELSAKLAGAEVALQTSEKVHTARQSAIEAERNSLHNRLQTAEADLSAATLRDAERAELVKERDRLATELASATAQFAGSHAQSQSQEVTELRAQRDALKIDLERASAELLLARSAADRLAAIENERYALAAKLAEMERQVQTGAHDSVVGERDVLIARVEAAEQRLAEALAQKVAAEVGPTETRKAEDLQRRFELAVDDVRSLKKRNAELEDQISALRANRPAPVEKASGAHDWESMKRKMIAELEAEGDVPDPKRKEERLTIENTIRITDDIVGQKDHEIADLRKLLEEQSNNLGSVAVGAAAISAALDQDELIQQERERLKAAQAEWRDKLRQAEIDVSLERARIARERSELEEKLSLIESERAQFQNKGPGGTTGNAGDGQKAQRGRWLERLGLKETDREKK